MNKYLIAVVMVVLAAAGYSQKSEAAACAATSYNNYGNPTGVPNTFTCDIDDKRFSNFTYSPTATGGAVAIPSSGVNLAPIVFSGGLPGTKEVGFSITFGLTAGAGQTNDINLGYTVTCIVNPNCITSDHLLFNGSITLAGGSASVTELKCLNSPSLSGCNPGLFSIFVNAPSPLSAQVTFLPFGCSPSGSPPPKCVGVSQETINKDILVTNGAVISLVQNTVDETVPEPASLALLGAGLFSLAAFRRRKTSK